MSFKNEYKNEIEQITRTIISANSITDYIIENYQDFVKSVKETYSKEYLITTVTKKQPDEIQQYYLEFKKPVFKPPVIEFLDGSMVNLDVTEAMNRECNYFMPIYASMTLFKKIGDEKQIIAESKKKKVGEIPIMVGSSLDNTDASNLQKGFFVVRGAGKQMLATEQVAKNHVFTKMTSGSEVSSILEACVFSQFSGYRYLNRLIISRTKLTFIFQPLNLKFNPVLLLKALNYDNLQISNKVLKTECAEHLEFSLLKYLQMSDQLVQKQISNLRAQLDPNNHLTDEEVLEKLKRAFKTYALVHLNNSVGDVLINKAQFMISMIRMAFLTKQNILGLSVIDHIKYKRLHSIKNLLIQLFDYTFNKQIANYREQLLKNLRKKSINLLNLFKQNMLTKGFIGPMLSGTWIGNKQNVTTPYEAHNYYSCITNFKKYYVL